MRTYENMKNYYKSKQLESSNRVANLCIEKLKELNKQMDKIADNPKEFLLRLSEFRRLNKQWKYYHAVARRILYEQF